MSLGGMAGTFTDEKFFYTKYENSRLPAILSGSKSLNHMTGGIDGEM